MVVGRSLFVSVVALDSLSSVFPLPGAAPMTSAQGDDEKEKNEKEKSSKKRKFKEAENDEDKKVCCAFWSRIRRVIAFARCAWVCVFERIPMLFC